MEEGLLSLKWNNHKSTFFQVLSVLREKHTYTDVTLACDGRLYPAHKFVLSTCSEYFSDIFTSTSGTSIVIVLKDVRRQDLEYLMDYMYLGQVDVAQSELPSLIKTAECLRIKGLAIPDDEPHKAPRRSAEEQEGSPPPSKKKRYLQEDDRPSTTTSSTTSNNITTTSSSSSSTSTSVRLQLETLPPPADLSSLVQHLRQVPHSHQPLQVPPLPPPTSQGSNKGPSSQPLSLNLSTQSLRSSQGSSSGPHSLASTTTQSSNPSISSPTHPTSISVPVIKEEAADPPETPDGYLVENFEENETKPDVSDPRHLDPDGSVPGPSGLQGSMENWDGDGDMASYSGGDSYSEGGLEEQGESEVQGATRHGAHQLMGPHLQHHSDPQHEHRTLSSRDTFSLFPNKRGTTSTNPQRKGILVQLDDHNDSESVLQNAGFLVESLSSINRPSADSSPAVYKIPHHPKESADIVFMSTDLHETANSSQGLQVTLAETCLFTEGSSFRFCPPHGPIAGQAVEGLTLTEKTAGDSQHLKATEGGGSNRYICQWCGRNFDRVSNLKRHMLLHSGIKPFKCLYCNYRATQKANVVQHLASRHRSEMRALLHNNINVNDILVPSGPAKR